MADEPVGGERQMSTVRALGATLRPEQWVKNLLVFAPLLFSGMLWRYDLLLRSLAAFGVLSVLSGCAHILDDLADMEHDRRHPTRRHRPIPAGRLRMRTALAAFVVLLSGGLIAADYLALEFFLVGLAYVVLLFAYTFVLSKVLLVDVFALAFAYVLRVLGGALATGVGAGAWMLVCTLLLGLFIALGRRRHQMRAGALFVRGGRDVPGYESYALGQMFSVTAAATIVVYALFTVAEGTRRAFGTGALVFTLPFVLYGVLRYMYLVHRTQAGPQDFLLGDWPLTLDVILWAGISALIIYG